MSMFDPFIKLIENMARASQKGTFDIDPEDGDWLVHENYVDRETPFEVFSMIPREQPYMWVSRDCTRFNWCYIPVDIDDVVFPDGCLLTDCEHQEQPPKGMSNGWYWEDNLPNVVYTNSALICDCDHAGTY